MSLPSSQDDDFMDLLFHRDLTFISNDQKRLLDKDDTWAVNLENTARGQAHVPGHVLETVKVARLHSNQKQQETIRPSSSRSNNSNYESAEEAHDGKLPEPIDPPTPNSKASSPERLLAWSPSPDRNAQSKEDDQPPHSPLYQSQEVEEIQTPLSQPRYTAPKGVHYNPASSCEPDEMDVEVPQGHVAVTTSANDTNRQAIGSVSTVAAKESVSNSTPTCAQPDERIIPGTVVQPPRSPKTPVPDQAQRRRRMKLIRLGSSPEKTKLDNPQSVVRLAATKTYIEGGSSNEVSSSYVPATCEEATEQKIEFARGDASTTIQIQAQPDVALIEPGFETHSKSESEKSAMSQDLPVEQEASLDGSTVLQETQPDLATDPFGAFNATYPDYSTHYKGTFDHFIKACVCLDFIRKKDLIRDQLYDDFIRSWSADYWIYVNNAKPGQEPLPAARWYNRQRGDILYSGGFINQGNVEYVLETYRKQVTKMQPFILTSENEDEDEDEDVEIIESDEVQPIAIGGQKEMQAEVQIVETAVEERTQAKQPDMETKQPSPKKRKSAIPSVPQHSSSPHPKSRAPIRRAPAPSAPSSSINTTKQRSSGGNPYLQRLASRSSSATNRKRSEAEVKRFREHVRTRKSSAASVSSSSTPRR